MNTDVPFWFIGLVFFILVTICHIMDIIIFMVLPNKFKKKIANWVLCE